MFSFEEPNLIPMEKDEEKEKDFCFCCCSLCGGVGELMGLWEGKEGKGRIGTAELECRITVSCVAFRRSLWLCGMMCHDSS